MVLDDLNLLLKIMESNLYRKGRLIQLYPKQKEIIESVIYGKETVHVGLMGRRVGKTMMLCIIAKYFSQVKKENVLIVSHNQNMTKIIVREFEDLFGEMPSRNSNNQNGEIKFISINQINNLKGMSYDNHVLFDTLDFSSIEWGDYLGIILSNKTNKYKIVGFDNRSYNVSTGGSLFKIPYTKIYNFNTIEINPSYTKERLLETVDGDEEKYKREYEPSSIFPNDENVSEQISFRLDVETINKLKDIARYRMYEEKRDDLKYTDLIRLAINRYVLNNYPPDAPKCSG